MGVLLERKKKKSSGGDRRWPEDGRVNAKAQSERTEGGGRRQDGRVIESNRAGEERIDRRGDETERGV